MRQNWLIRFPSCSTERSTDSRGPTSEDRHCRTKRRKVPAALNQPPNVPATPPATATTTAKSTQHASNAASSTTTTAAAPSPPPSAATAAAIGW